MLTPNCHPVILDLDINFIDKWRMSGMERKQAEFKALCADCPVQGDCMKQGQYVNMDNERMYLDGIFGGMTQNERKALGL
jgi:hypothetical protein